MTLEDKGKSMFERFFKGDQKEAIMTTEKMLAGELRTPKGLYFDNLKTIVTVLTLAGFILPLAPIDKAVAAGPPRETKQMSEFNPQTETGQQKMAEILQKIKDQKGLEVVMAGGSFGTQEQTKEAVQKKYRDAYQEAKNNQTPYQEVSFTTENQPVALENFLNALGIKINSEVYQTLDQTDYRAVFCYRDSNAIDRGLILSLQSGDVDHFIKLYPQLEAGLLSWQRTIFSDLKNIFFPDSDFDTTSPKFKTAYANPPDADQIEIATIKDESGADRFVGYNSSQQKIYLANSQECLKRILDAHPDDPDL